MSSGFFSRQEIKFPLDEPEKGPEQARWRVDSIL